SEVVHGSCQRAAHLSYRPCGEMGPVINALAARPGTPRLPNHGEISAGCGLASVYSLAALTKAIGGAAADAAARLGTPLPALRALAALFDSTKSPTRGPIPAPNPAPLNPPPIPPPPS